MCFVSAVGDEWGRQFPERWPDVPIQPIKPFIPYVEPKKRAHPFTPIQDDIRHCDVCGGDKNAWAHRMYEMLNPKPKNPVSRDEFDALREEVKALKELLLEAKRYDEETGQPDCEMEEKIEFIRRLAEYVGVNVDEVFRPSDG